MVRFNAGTHNWPLFFENEEEKPAIVNGEGYHSMLTDFFLPQVVDMDQAGIHFKQDGATCHTTWKN